MSIIIFWLWSIVIAFIAYGLGYKRGGEDAHN